MNKIEHIFWDTCVLAALLAEDKDSDLPSIEQYLHDAKKGDCKIYASTISTAEILPSRITGRRYRSYQRFLKDYEGAVIPISPDPNIMALASRLRDVPYTKQATKTEIAPRGMDVPDAVILATALILGLGYRVKLDKFHTYDNGKKRSVNGGKCVPLLNFQDWCLLLDEKHKAIVQPVIDLPRSKPIHPHPTLPGVHETQG